jgi:Ribosomal protein S6e
MTELTCPRFIEIEDWLQETRSVTNSGLCLQSDWGNDKGFPMKNGVLHPTLVPPFPGNSCYVPANTKSVGGCFVGPDLSVLSVVVVKQDESDIGESGGRRMQALEVHVKDLRDLMHDLQQISRASKIRKFFNLTKEDDVRKLRNEEGGSSQEFRDETIHQSS